MKLYRRLTLSLNSSTLVNRTIQLLLVFLFTVNLGEGLFAPLFAVFITSTIPSASLTTVGLAVAIFSITKSLIQIPLAKRLDTKRGERDDFSAILLGAVIGIIYAFSLMAIKQVWQLYLLSVINGVGGACLMAAYYSIFSHHLDKNQEGFEWSLLSVGGLTLSVAIGGALGGILTDLLGFRTIFLIAGTLNIVAVILLLWLYPHLRKNKVLYN